MKSDTSKNQLLGAPPANQHKSAVLSAAASVIPLGIEPLEMDALQETRAL
jgi:hypothetical protein